MTTEHQYDNLTKDQQRQILDQQILSHEERHFRAVLDRDGAQADGTLEDAQKAAAVEAAEKTMAQADASLGVLREAKKRLLASPPKDAK